MRNAGRLWFPVLFFWILIAVNSPLHSSEVTFYSLPEEQANQQLDELLTWQIPLRQWIPLNGAWQVLALTSRKDLGEVRLPFTFQGADGFVFERNFDLKKREAGSYRLHLGQLNGRVKVFVNESLLYQRENDYQAADVPVADSLLRDGQNHLRIILETESRHPGRLPRFTPVNMPRLSTGVLEPLYLEIRPRPALDFPEAHAVWADSQWQVQARLTASNLLPAGGRYRVTVTLRSPQGILETATIDAGTPGAAPWDLLLKPTHPLSPWDENQPRQYWLEAQLDSAGKAVDLLRRPIAVRSARIVRNRLQINQRMVAVNGINYVYQNREGSDVFDPELVRKDLEHIKELGFNAVRVVLRPLPESFYRMCDELGLLCFQDLPFVFWGISAEFFPTVFATWQRYYRMTAELAERYNCIVAIGLGYYPDCQSLLQQQELKSLAANLPPAALPRYASTLIPSANLGEIVDFQIAELVKRVDLDRQFEKMAGATGTLAYMPSAFSKAFSYRVDSTVVTLDLLQTNEVYHRVRAGHFPGEIAGHFIPTYSDFYLQLPSVQNGAYGDFSLNRVGLVDLQRRPREFPANPSEDNADLLTPEGLQPILESRATHSFIYIIASIINALVFLLFYKQFRPFRINLHYSIRKPHGFFTDLQERIIIPVKSSLFLLLIIAVNGAVVFSSLCYYFRDTLVLDYLLSLLFYSPTAKFWAARIVWDQPLFLWTATAAITVIFFGLALLIKIFSLFGNTRVFFNQALAVSIWSASPMVLLLPLGAFMYTALLMMKSYWILIGVLVYFHVWVYLRWVNGTRVLTGKLYGPVLVGSTFLFLLIVSLGGYLAQQYLYGWEHLQFIFRLARM